MMSWGEIIPSYGNGLNHPVFLPRYHLIHDSFSITRLRTCLCRRPCSSCFQSDRLRWWPHLWQFECMFPFPSAASLCLYVFIFPRERVCVCVLACRSCLFCLCAVGTIFSSKILCHYFLILHVACWASSRCHLPAEWCIPLYRRSVAVITL